MFSRVANRALVVGILCVSVTRALGEPSQTETIPFYTSVHHFLYVSTDLYQDDWQKTARNVLLAALSMTRLHDLRANGLVRHRWYSRTNNYGVSMRDERGHLFQVTFPANCRRWRFGHDERAGTYQGRGWTCQIPRGDTIDVRNVMGERIVVSTSHDGLRSPVVRARRAVEPTGEGSEPWSHRVFRYAIER